MKAKELIELLQRVDPETEIVVSRDSEGNGYNKLGSVNVDEYAFRPDGHEVEIGLRTLTKELERQGYSDEDVLDGTPCVVIWP